MAPLLSALVLSLCAPITAFVQFLLMILNWPLIENKIESSLMKMKDFRINTLEEKSNTCTKQWYQCKPGCCRVTKWGTKVKCATHAQGKGQRLEARRKLSFSRQTVVLFLVFFLIHFHGGQKMAIPQLPSLHIMDGTTENAHFSWSWLQNPNRENDQFGLDQESTPAPASYGQDLSVIPDCPWTTQEEESIPRKGDVLACELDRYPKKYLWGRDIQWQTQVSANSSTKARIGCLSWMEPHCQSCPQGVP